MIPIRDLIPTRKIAIVNYLLIAANILVFIFQSLSGPSQEALVYQFALIPGNFTANLNLANITDIFTSMFMHAGLLHLGGNILYLWIFGDNVEDHMGSFKYLIFYLTGGLIAALTHIFFNPNSVIPTVGASGAIAAVLGAYLVLYPHSRVMTFIPLGYFFTLRAIPAVIVLGVWFILQLFNGVVSVGGADIGGTAFWAHIGGFVAGMVIAKLFFNQPQRETAIRW